MSEEDWTDKYYREFEQKIREVEKRVEQKRSGIELLKDIYLWTYKNGICGAFDEEKIAEELSVLACRAIVAELVYNFKIEE